MLTLFPFKSTYLAKVEVYILTSREWMSFVSAPPPPTWNKQERTSAYSDWFRSKLAGKVCLAVWPSFYQIKEWQTEFLQSREPRQKCDVSQLWWHKMMLRFIPYLVNMDLSVAAFLLPTSQTSSIICYVTFLHITDRSAVLIMYHTSPPVLKVRGKNQSLGRM